MGRPPLLKLDQVLSAIERLTVLLGKSPTVEEIRSELDVGSTRTVRRYLQRLEDEGFIERWPGARGLRVLRPSKPRDQATTSVPLLGRVPAGGLSLAEQEVEGYVRLPREMLRPAHSRHFLLRVRGDSMNRALVADELIESGDLLLVRQDQDPPDRSIIVALVDGEVTVKRLLRGPNHVILKPESTESHFQPIVLTRDFTVQGVAVRVLKRGSQLLEEPEN